MKFTVPHIRGQGRLSRQFASIMALYTLLHVSVPIALGQVQGDAELLKLVTFGNRTNQERIQTWRGRVHLKDETVIAGNASWRSSSIVEFAYDRQTGATRWDRTYESFERTESDGKIIHPNLDSLNQKGVLKGGTYYQVNPQGFTSAKDGARSSLMHLLAPDRVMRGPTSTDFDPMYCFTDHGENLADRFDFFHRSAKDPGMRDWRVTRTGDIVVMEMLMSTTKVGVIMNRYEMNVTKGANLTAYHSKDSLGVEDWDIAYVERSGTWVPSEIHYNNSRSGKTITRETKWLENTVNEPLPENIFTVESLGVRKGDLVVDNRTGINYKFGDDEAPEPPPKGRGGSTFRYLMFLNGLILLAVAVGFVLKRSLRIRARSSP